MIRVDITKDVDEKGRFYMDEAPSFEYKVKNLSFKPIVFNDPRKQRAYEKQNPREFELYIQDKDTKRYYLPRSAYWDHKNPRSESLDTTWCLARLDMINEQWMLRDYQFEAVEEMLKTIDSTQWWLIVSWTWTWKTRMIRALIKSLEKPVVLVVPNNVVWDNADESFEDLWFDIEHIHWKQDKIDPNKSYVCHYSTLELNYEELNDWNRVLILDEAHMSPCSTLLKSICLWRADEPRTCVFWVTATPYRAEFWEEWFVKLFWYIYDTKQEALPVNVLCIKKTREYDLEYAMKCQEWLSSDSPEIRNKILNNDSWRTKEIIDMALRCYHRKWEETWKVIVFVNRTEFAKELYSQIKKEIWQDAYLLIWETSNQDIKKSVAKLNQYIIVANVKCAGEWLDIPALDTWILTFITKDKKSLAQMAWRVRRASEWKSCGYFIDFMDTIKVWPTRPVNGWGMERRKLYSELGFSLQDI